MKHALPRATVALFILLTARAATASTASTAAAPAPIWTSIGPPAPGYVVSVAFGPAAPALAWASVAGAGVFRSTDGGVTWQGSNRGIPVDESVLALVAHPRQGGLVYAKGQESFLVRSLDGGLSWGVLPVPGTEVFSFAPAPSDPAIVYAGTNLGLFVSRNQGSNWRHVAGSGLPRSYSAVAVAVDPANPRWVYAGIRSSADYGLFASQDGGQTWVRRLRGIPDDLYCDPRRGGFVYLQENGFLQRSRDRGANWEPYYTQAPVAGSLVFDPQRPATAYITTAVASPALDSAQLLATVDDGLHWQAVTTGQGQAGTTSVLAVSSAGTLLLGGIAPTLFLRSADGGATWQSAESGIVASHIQAVAFGGAGVLLAGESYPHFGVERSLDGGISWTQVLATPLGVAALAASPADPTIQYAGISEAQGIAPTILWKSSDNGATWEPLPYPQPATTPFHGIAVADLAVDAGDPQTVYLAAQSSFDGLPGGQGVYRSTDGGQTWQLTALPPLQWNGLAAAPGQPGTVWAITNLGAYKSTDQGVTWNLALTPATGTFLRAAAVAPSDPDVVWVAGDTAFYRSADGGATWSRLRGLAEEPFFAFPELSHPLAIDPQDPYTLYVAWNGGVAFRALGSGWQSLDGGLDSGLVSNLGLCLAIDPADPTRLLFGTAGASLFETRVQATP